MENTQPEQQSTEQAPQEEPNFADTKKGGVGPVLGIVVIIALIAIGGYYYFTSGVEQIPNYEAGEEDATVQALSEQSTSDTISDIEADVEATDLSEVDALLEDLEADLQGP